MQTKLRERGSSPRAHSHGAPTSHFVHLAGQSTTVAVRDEKAYSWRNNKRSSGNTRKIPRYRGGGPWRLQESAPLAGKRQLRVKGATHSFVHSIKGTGTLQPTPRRIPLRSLKGNCCSGKILDCIRPPAKRVIKRLLITSFCAGCSGKMPAW